MITYEDDYIFSPLFDDKLLLYNEFNILSFISDIVGVVKPIDIHLVSWNYIFSFLKIPHFNH